MVFSSLALSSTAVGLIPATDTTKHEIHNVWYRWQAEEKYNNFLQKQRLALPTGALSGIE